MMGSFKKPNQKQISEDETFELWRQLERLKQGSLEKLGGVLGIPETFSHFGLWTPDSKQKFLASEDTLYEIANSTQNVLVRSQSFPRAGI